MKLPKESEIRNNRELQIRRRKEELLKEMVEYVEKTKEQLIYETFRYSKEFIREHVSQTTDPKQIAWGRFILYLYSNQISKERFEILLRNGDYLVEHWDKIAHMVEEIKLVDFDEYPIVKKYFDMWCNSLIGEDVFFRVGNGKVSEGRKHAKKLFIKFQLKRYTENLPKEPKEGSKDTAYYSKKYSNEQLKQMRDLSPEGYKGFFLFAIPDQLLGKIQYHIIYDNRNLTPEEYTEVSLLPATIQEIYKKFRMGVIK